MNHIAQLEHVNQWQLGALIFDRRTRKLRRGQQQLYLEPRQYQLLLTLLESAEKPVSREQLIQNVWQGRIVSDGAINRAISMLRKAFAKLDPNSDYIETLPKLGYRLIPAAVSLFPEEIAAPQVQSKLKRRLGLTVAVLCVLACSIVIWFVLSPRTAELKASNAIPHTSFNGRESQLSSNHLGTALLYQRESDNGRHQIWLNSLADNQHYQLTANDEDSRNPALSPDGSQFAFVQHSDESCQIILQTVNLLQPADAKSVHAALSRVVLQSCPIDNLPLLSWQADGKALFFRQRQDKSQPYQLYKLNIASGSLQQLTLLAGEYSGNGDIALAASSTPDELALLRYISPQVSELQILNSNNGEIIHKQSLPLRATALAWYSDNIVLLSAGQMLYQYHIQESRLSPLFWAADTLNSFVVIGHTLYISSTEINADIWQTDSDGVTTLRIDSSRLDTIPRLSHDAEKLVFLSTRQGHEQLWLQQPDGTEQLLTELPGQPGFIRPEWSADDRELLFSKDEAVYSVDVESGELRTLLTADKHVGVANWGADDNSLLYSSQREGDWQLYSHDISNNTEQKLTEQGGYSGRIWQGRLYFSKYHYDGLWVKELPSGREQLLIKSFDKINWLNWQIEHDKLYYYTPRQGIYRLDLVHGDTVLHLAEPDQFVRHFSVRKGRTVFVRHSELQGDIYRVVLSD